MPITYRIDGARDIVRVEVQGAPTLAEELSVYGRFRSDPAYRRELPILIDDRRRTAPAEVDELRRLADELSEPSVDLAGVRCAILVGQDVQFGMSRMFEVFAEKTGLVVRTFRDERAALQWATAGGDR